MPTLTINTIYKEGQDTTVISSTAPTGAVGFEKDTGQTGFFVYSESPYTLWLKNSSGVWSSHQTFTAGNLLVSSTFAWGEYEAAYLQTAVSDHIAYVYPRSGAILIDGDTSDGVSQADTLLTAGSNTGIGVTTAPIEQFPNWTNSNGHILPDTNATYDIGSAAKKVRHLFLSDNSLWVGDSNKITISNGKIKTTKRKKETPQYILDAGATPQDFMDFYPARTAASLTVQEWVDFGRAFVGDPTITAAKMYGSSDFSEDADWEDYLVVDSPTSGDLTLSGTTGQAASLTEIRDAIDNKYLFDCAGATVYYDGVPYPRDVHLRDTSVQFWNEDSSQRGASIALNLNPGQQAQDLWISMMHIENQPRKIYLDAGPGGTIASTYHAPGEVEVRGTLSLNTETLSVTDVAQSLTDNTAAIAANVTDIAAIDTSGIATNAAAIAANVTDIAAIDTSGIATNAAAIAAIDMGVTTSFTDSAGNANFSIEPTGNPDAGVRYLKVGADTTPGHDYSDRDSVLHLVGGLPEYNSGMVMLQGRVAIRDKNLNVQLTDVATSIVDNTSNIATNTIDITSNSKNFLLLPYNVAHDGEANTENHQFLLASGGTLFGQSTDISLITDNGGGLFINAPAGEAFLRVDGKKLSVKDTVNLLELIKAATDQANDFAHFQALMGLAFANWDPNV
ncbi:MAG: hypothetical protein H8E74_02250 [Gammaproteobacteria bacterium]|nr:hypothetical protein [Gammaproteobacteria bacterium]